MRRLIIITIIFLSSCRVHCDLGMSEYEFIKRNKGKVHVEEASQNYKVFRSGLGYNTYFYYFTNGHLTRVDRGEYVPNIIIQNR